MLCGLESEDGKIRKRWNEIHLAEDWRLFLPCDPATLAYLIDKSTARDGIDPTGVSASQTAGVRELWLTQVTDYFLPPSKLIAGMTGTLKHEKINRGSELFIFEKRFSDEIGSAQIDSYFHPAAMLVDLKNIGWYKCKLMLRDGMLKEGREYALQVNRQRMLLEASGLPVASMFLSLIPRDLTAQTRAEALKLGITKPDIISLAVPLMDDAEVMEFYRSRKEGKAEAIASGTAPFCTSEETWGYKKCTGGWCPVAGECKRLADIRGERVPWEK